MRKFAFSLTGDHADADDLVHDLAVKVLEKGLPECNDPVPWLLTLCKNIWIDQLRYREVRTRPQTGDSTEGDEEVVSREAELHILHTERVIRSLKHLPETQRLALSLVAIEGRSYAEAAEILNVPVGTVMSRIARARAALMKRFNENPEVQA